MLAVASWLVPVLAVVFVLVCTIMMLVILIQRPRGGGLSGAFGGAGGGQTMFGSKVGDMLTWFTVGCFVVFLLLAMGLTWTIHAETAKPELPAAEETSETSETPPAPVTPGPLPLPPVGTQPAATPIPGSPETAPATQPA